MRTIELKIVPPDDADLRSLTERLDKELLTLYPAEGIFGLDLSDPKAGEMTFCVAYANGTPAGCGAYRPLEPGIAELKRFFVEKSFRGKGIASLILNFVEDKAGAAGFGVLRLETGPKQPDAIGLYSKFGYRQIPLYGEYNDCQFSYCMEKKLQ
jgi:putative acetyltransferase